MVCLQHGITIYLGHEETPDTAMATPTSNPAEALPHRTVNADEAGAAAPPLLQGGSLSEDNHGEGNKDSSEFHDDERLEWGEVVIVLIRNVYINGLI